MNLKILSKEKNKVVEFGDMEVVELWHAEGAGCGGNIKHKVTDGYAIEMIKGKKRIRLGVYQEEDRAKKEVKRILEAKANLDLQLIRNVATAISYETLVYEMKGER